MTEYYTIDQNTGNLIRHECESLPSGKFKFIEGNFVRVGNSNGYPLHMGKDSFHQGIDGVVNPVDGKHYDSKSQYYRKLKDTGHHVIDQKEPKQKKEIVGDFNVKKELTQATQQVLSKHKGRK